MIVPRSWSNIEKQRDPQQTAQFAEPTATDIRWKLAAFFLFGGWLTTVFSLYHSIKHYKPRNRVSLKRPFGMIRHAPSKFLLTLPISLVMVGYEAACSFKFSISSLNVHPTLSIMYGLGWGSIALVILIYEIYGYVDPNEDRVLIQQRRIRGAEIDQEIGITTKPQWWRHLKGDNRELNVHDAIARNVNEIGGGRVTTQNMERTIEMGNMPLSKQRESTYPVGDLDSGKMAVNLLSLVAEPSDGNDSAGTGVTLGAQTQVVRSMLDV